MAKSQLLEEVRRTILSKGLAESTAYNYSRWIKRFIFFHDRRHPRELGESEISEFLAHLVVDRELSESTQNIALNAIVFLYEHVLKIDLGTFPEYAASRRLKLLPTVFSEEEVEKVISCLEECNSASRLASP